jgi:hypothetical protein
MNSNLVDEISISKRVDSFGTEMRSLFLLNMIRFKVKENLVFEAILIRFNIFKIMEFN